MQSIITLALILALISPCFGSNYTFYNVMDFGAVGDAKTDDSQAFLKAWRSTCGAEGTPTLLIPQNYVFLLSALLLKGPCNATTILIKLEGKIVAPAKDAWVGHTNSLISIVKVERLTVDGSGGLIDGFGSSWWPCKYCPRPATLIFDACNYLTVHDLSITNSPKSHIHVHGCKDATFSHINITAPADSPNTDGIDVTSSKNIVIQNSTIQSGDDCVAVSGGSVAVNVTGIACGPGHGISIGSLGKRNDTVEEVYVRNCSFTKTRYGARIKTFPIGFGCARKITFEEITLVETRYPILIDQNYGTYYLTNGGGVEISGVRFRGFQGTSFDGRAITLDCGQLGCHDIELDQIDISSSPAKPAYCFCNNAHGTVTSTVPNCSCLLP
ncbi:hypothetical protein PHAVU_010G037300, partial [Phaseolus vulgaris]|uniref:Polygalacturonase n=1 Tax=Phaseolus vulgaris TaxID=3885 RepID=V7ANZ7_PHAVU|nr:hypothetical protein PHAVU_010G037300g [Phaseolus vulgaris]ESW06313.1 hypothetical protein PHAVU_010G037300g [Phaseolus vulgaris]